MSLKRTTILLLALVGAPIGALPAQAWGGDGHRVICEISLLEMQPATRARIEQLLADGPERYRSFPEACVWADREGRAAPYNELGNRHYVNVERGADGLDLQRDCADDCIVSAIVLYSGELAAAGTTPHQRTIALKFLAHFVGDLHQPLHTGHADDRGGNSIEVRFLGRARNASDRPYNLHEIWDSTLLAESGLDRKSWKTRAAELQREIGASDRLALDSLDLVGWTDESFAILGRDVHAGAELDRSYYERSLPVVHDRLRKAGLRLARLLDRLIGPSADAPFWVGSRKGSVHAPGCKAAAKIKPASLRVWPAPPADRSRHTACRRRP